MKNQIIKKMMAYLLVGAMVISTPITASATELENAYSPTDDDVNYGTGSGTGTSTSTNTAAVDIELPEEIDKQLPHIVGIALDKTSLEFSEIGDSAFLQARALFDDYDAADEEMQWITKDEKEKIEANIHWYSDDFSVASIGTVKNADGSDVMVEDENNNEAMAKGKVGPKAEIKAVGEGTTKVYAWIEADGKQYVNAPQRPTPGDFIATATVTVKGKSVTDIKFETEVPWVIKRQYDLTKYTTIILGEFEKSIKEYGGSVVYTITGYEKKSSDASKIKAKATVTDAGILKVKAGDPGEKIKFAITTESGFSKEFEITLDQPNPTKRITVIGDSKRTLDMGSTSGYNDGKKRVEAVVSVNVEAISEGKTTDDLIWTSNKKTIADVKVVDPEKYAKDKDEDAEGDGSSAVIYTTGNVGTAKITVKSTNGKSASFTVTVNATPEKMEVDTVKTYTGKAATIPVTLFGENGLKLPQGKTKLTFNFIDPEEADVVKTDVVNAKDAKKYASVNKNKGVITPKNILSQDGTTKDQVILRIGVDALLGKKTSPDFKGRGSTDITIIQSDLTGLEIVPMEKGKGTDTNNKSGWHPIADITSASWTSKASKLTLSKVYVGNTYRFDPKCTGKDDQLDSIVWTSTGKGIQSSLEGNNYRSEITNSSKATIKASYIVLENTSKGSKAVKKTKTITLKPIQMAQSLVIDKPVQVVNMKQGKAATVTVKVKALNPKTAKDKIQWKVLTAGPVLDANDQPQAIKVGEGDSAKVVTAQLSNKNEYTSVNNEVVDKDGKVYVDKTPWNDAKNKSIKITIPAGTENGSVIKIGAYAQGGAVAYAYIYVTKPTAAVEATVGTPAKTAAKGKNTYDLQLGKTASIIAKIKETKTSEAQEIALPAWTVGDTASYTSEYVTYTLDKKSALVVSVDKNGKITPKKIGKATITIKSASGKKSTKVTINVIAPTK